MSTDRGDPSMSPKVFEPGTQPSASRLEQTDRLVRNVYGIGQTRVIYRNNRIGIGGGASSQPTEWAVAIANTTHLAIIYHRPVVYAGRRIPKAWADDEDFYGYAPDDYYFYPELTVDLLDAGVGLGSGFIFVEIDLDADTLIGMHSPTRPFDSPADSVVRWPLVHITETATTVSGVTTYQWAVDAVLHTGQIKIPALLAP